MNRADAIKAVESVLNEDFDPSESGRLVVLEELTRERHYGWVFFVNTARYAETRDRRFTVIGNGPIIYRTSDASIHRLPTGVDVDEAIADFERRQSWGNQTGSESVLRVDTTSRSLRGVRDD
jgi:hypothetical protein